MDRKTEVEHLSRADANISAARQRIARQLRLIARLEEGGHELTTAQAILRTMRNSLELMEEHRRAIKREIASCRDSARS